MIEEYWRIKIKHHSIWSCYIITHSLNLFHIIFFQYLLMFYFYHAKGNCYFFRFFSLFFIFLVGYFNKYYCKMLTLQLSMSPFIFNWVDSIRYGLLFIICGQFLQGKKIKQEIHSSIFYVSFWRRSTFLQYIAFCSYILSIVR